MRRAAPSPGASFDDRASRLASHLWAEGLRPGDKVAIDLLNRPEYLETFFAALLLGCVPVNVNYRYGPTETGLRDRRLRRQGRRARTRPRPHA